MLLLTLLLAGGAAAVAILRLRGYPAVLLDPKAGSGQAAQGAAFTRELVVLVLVAIAAQGAIATVRVGSLVEQQMRTIRRFALIGGGVLLVLTALVQCLGFSWQLLRV
jgi:hypothetical protein